MDINRLGNRWEVGTFSCGHAPSVHSSGEVEGCISRQKMLTSSERMMLRSLVACDLERRTILEAHRNHLETIQRKLSD